MWYRNRKAIPEGSSDPGEVVFEILDASDGLGFGMAIADIRRSEMHFHRRMVETYTLISGVLRVYVGDQREELSSPGQSVVIPPNTPHWAESASESPARISVFSTPAWTPDDHVLSASGKSIAELADVDRHPSGPR